jgi:hypothetical protein
MANRVNPLGRGPGQGVLAILLSVTALVVGAEWDDPPPARAELPDDGTALVRAVVAEADEAPRNRIGLIEGKAKILHVYCGPTGLVGKTFSLYSVNEETVGMSLNSPPVKGQVGIFAVKMSERGLSSRRYGYGCVFPYREGVDPRYEQAKLLAEAVETVGAAVGERRLELIRSGLASPVPEIAAWSAHALAWAAYEEAIRRAGSGEGATVAGQVALDEALESVSAPLEWPAKERIARSEYRARAPKERIALAESWIRRARTEDDAVAINDRLGFLYGNKRLPPADLLVLAGSLREVAAKWPPAREKVDALIARMRRDVKPEK